jgi:hypothetical protein
MLKVFLWTFGVLLIIEYATTFINLKEISAQYSFGLLVVGALIGIIPESGPHMIFVMMFAKGLIPFSVLLTSSIVQDGHGLLPMLSYSVKDSLYIKIFNFVFGLIIGIIIYLLGY